MAAAGNNNVSFKIVEYRDCLPVLGHPNVLDGCQRFISQVGDLYCKTCKCHRDYHRRVEIQVNVDPRMVQRLKDHAVGDHPVINLDIALPEDNEVQVAEVVNPRRQSGGN